MAGLQSSSVVKWWSIPNAGEKSPEGLVYSLFPIQSDINAVIGFFYHGVMFIKK